MGLTVLQFHRKTTIKGQFRLQMIVLRDETGASFKTNFESSKSLLKALGLQKGP